MKEETYEGVIWEDNSVSYRVNGKVYTTEPHSSKEEAIEWLKNLDGKTITGMVIKGVR